MARDTSFLLTDAADVIAAREEHAATGLRLSTPWCHSW
jgi:hypothetical protein